ncbi:MAG: hypothetical protein WDZ59_03130 [Pirellulales bacterium]
MNSDAQPERNSATIGQLALEDLLAMPEAELQQLDVAWVNLQCATGLPSSHPFDAADCLARLDQYAQHIRQQTERFRPRFLQQPEACDNSEALFRMIVLVNGLREDCGVAYNLQRIHDPDFTNSEDLFIHGLFSANGGTCSSLPVAFAAIGRRLGYPVRLVHAKAHLFVRWDDPTGDSGFPPGRVNIEGACEGMDSLSDEYYTTWPMPIEPQELTSGQYLHSLSPSEELAFFLSVRGNCLQDNARFEEAAQAYQYACAFAPHIERYHLWRDVNSILCGEVVSNADSHIRRIADEEKRRIAALQTR